MVVPFDRVGDRGGVPNRGWGSGSLAVRRFVFSGVSWGNYGIRRSSNGIRVLRQGRQWRRPVDAHEDESARRA